jgi:hypothetical protein
MPGRLFRYGVRSMCCGAAVLLPVACATQPATDSSGFSPSATSGSGATAPQDTDAGAFSLTVYSTADPATFSPQDLLQDQLNNAYNSGSVVYAPGYGVVRELRKMSLIAGLNRLEFTDVASGIDPTTVSFQSLTAPDSTSVLEQNFEYDLTNADKLLQKYLDRHVVLTLTQAGTSKTPVPPISGKLLSSAGGSYIVQTDDPMLPLAIVSSQNVTSVRLADSGTKLVSKPTLNWKVSSKTPGRHEVLVTYQTDGLTWRADYNLLLSENENTADLSAWVTMLNSSGIAFPEAKLKLVAGNVQRFISPDRANRSPVANTLFAGGAATADSGFKEKGFFEYHLYTLGRATTLANNSTKQIELFPPKTGVPVEKVYVYYGIPTDQQAQVLQSPQTDRTFGTETNKRIDLYVRFKNAEANHLGSPLPAGRMRVYKTDPADGNREFVGEDVIQHTPKDEEVLVRLGTAFDLVGERIQTDYQDTPHTITESFRITVRNHKDQPARVIVKENLYRWFNWEITESSEKWEKKDYRTIHLPIDVPANGEKKLTYTVKYSF